MTAGGQADAPRIHRGLAGVHVDRSHICMIDGKNGHLSYRGYAIGDLVEHASFEETSYLLLYGVLPSAAELGAFKKEMAEARHLPREVLSLIASMARAHPMDVLRSVISVLGSLDPERGDESAEAVRRKAVWLIGQSAAAVAAQLAFRAGRRPLAADAGLSHAADLLRMLLGQPADPAIARLFDQDMIVHAEHGSNASTFAARVVAGAGSDFHAAITAAVSCFAGVSHGGAVEGVMRMVREIGVPEHAKDYVAGRHQRREPVMGFGHRVYRTTDPRARYLRSHAEVLSRLAGNRTWLSILDEVVSAMAPYTRHGVNVNVDFYAAVSYALLGIPDDFFGAIFALSRLPGWAAHFLEQKQDNILIRPLLLYVGEDQRRLIPISERGQPDKGGYRVARRRAGGDPRHMPT